MCAAEYHGCHAMPLQVPKGIPSSIPSSIPIPRLRRYFHSQGAPRPRFSYARPLYSRNIDINGVSILRYSTTDSSLSPVSGAAFAYVQVLLAHSGTTARPLSQPRASNTRTDYGPRVQSDPIGGKAGPDRDAIYEAPNPIRRIILAMREGGTRKLLIRV
ncbi:hypothetical protein GGR50DRAFT_348476 [Xylaria sp. CBS 124048]|nr:hypothetical protein GGR50DRAFT_348476 [Xylaria sp. CBS 124048]